MNTYMEKIIFTDDDIRQITGHGKTIASVMDEIRRFETGFGYPDIISPASAGNGIHRLSDAEISEYQAKAESFKGKIVKFVPASGAATRMFKDLFSGLEEIRAGKKPNRTATEFADRFHEFPFSTGCHETTPEGKLEYVLGKDGLDYGNRPKGLVLFHSYGNEKRTAFAEHFVEAAMYAVSGDGIIRMHFTVSPEHMDDFRKELEQIRPVYEKRFGYRYDVSFSIQDPSTDTIAVNQDNTPFRTSTGKLLFRPAGHGALIRNLAAVDADMTVIKNIDNVTVEQKLSDTVIWKKVLIGYLASTRDKLYSYVRLLRKSISEGMPDETLIREIENFMDSVLYTDCKTLEKKHEKSGNTSQEDRPCQATGQNRSDRMDYIRTLLGILDRPLRVCGMVINEGAPGGGPYIVKEKDGSRSLQILESSQIDLSDSHCREAMEKSTHFNPVDLVCSTKDCDGKPYDLSEYVDNEAGFISQKSYEGKSLKALELPGLWNGAMSRWNTIFIEVPVSTFNPVKTVMDLLGRA